MAKISGKDGKVLHGSEITITGAVHDTGVVTVTAAANGLSVGDRILIGDVVGMTDLNTHFIGPPVLFFVYKDNFKRISTTSPAYNTALDLFRTSADPHLQYQNRRLLMS